MLNKETIEEIVNRDNLVIRNLQITQGYYRISQGMRKLIGGKNISWCAFATHASKTAGQAIRHELMPRRLKSAMIRMAGFDNTYVYLSDVLDQSDEEFDEESRTKLAEAMKRVSLLVSGGNVMVFDELAWPFTCLVNAFCGAWAYDPPALQAFMDEHLEPGPLEAGGKDYLIEAFTAYYNARFETDPARKAEYVLQGNLLVGLHEQTRLQSHIEQALAVPFDVFIDGGKREDGEKQDAGGVQKRRRSRITRHLVTKVVTRMLMSITLPSRSLKLGEDVVAPTGVHSFPADLLSIENHRCQQLVHTFNEGKDTLSGSAAGDWVRLDDRMRFVVHFFRSHQQYKRMFEPPFLASQVPAIEAGHFPAGPL
jgi:hypothetical protein